MNNKRKAEGGSRKAECGSRKAEGSRRKAESHPSSLILHPSEHPSSLLLHPSEHPSSLILHPSEHPSSLLLHPSEHPSSLILHPSEHPSEHPSSFSLFPSYKDSGVEWIGDIPSHWWRSKLKYCLKKKITDGPHETPIFIDEGVPFLSVDGIQNGELVFEGCRFISFEEHSRYSQKCSIEKGDLLMGKAASIGKIARVKVDFPFSVWSPLALLKPLKRKTLPLFLEFVLKSPQTQYQIEILSTSNTQKNISMDDIPRIELVFPDLPEQQAIADFLDDKTGKIDRLISTKRRQIELLKEQRTAVINQAVTGQLAVGSEQLAVSSEQREKWKLITDKWKLKEDSGIEWLGKIPKHWRIKRLKFLTTINTGDKDTVNNIENGEYPFFVRSQTVERINSYTYDGEAVLTAGDGVGVAKVFHYINGKFDYHQRVYKFSDFKDILGKFFFHYIKANLYKEVIKISAKSTVDSLRMPMLQNFVFALPPIEEQNYICEYIEEITNEIDTTISKAKKQIELLTEYRTALISGAVTGKIDVRDEVLRLKDEGGEMKEDVV
jgi:type I restriction enzyme, S subunit